jgi:hypothetical protein
VDKSLRNVEYDDVEDESDDLYLTDVRFVKECLPRIAGQLRSLSVSDFWFQSYWRKSEVLSLISSCCEFPLRLCLYNFACNFISRVMAFCNSEPLQIWKKLEVDESRDGLRFQDVL